MTQFAITIWAWQATGEAPTLALVALFTAVPQIFTSPLAGAIVDRWDRKHVMMLSDLATGIATAALLLHTGGLLPALRADGLPCPVEGMLQTLGLYPW